MSPHPRDLSSCGTQPVPLDQGKKREPEQKRYWPLPGTEHTFPEEGRSGSFREDRGDRHHSGVDLYAHKGARVVSIEDGKVVSDGVFTSPDLVPYWNRTYQVTIAHASGVFCRYAELMDITVEADGKVYGGEVIGHVGEVLDMSLIGSGSPANIRALKERGSMSMLHFEVFTSHPGPDPNYLGGNWFSPDKPAHLLDPAMVLRDFL